MHEHSKNRLPWFDWLLAAAMVALLLIVGAFVVLSPTWWLWCINMLDVRDWSHWAWLRVVVGLLVVLATIQFWPNGTQCKPSERGLADAPGDRSVAGQHGK